jgi:hypothetical protein
MLYDLRGAGEHNVAYGEDGSLGGGREGIGCGGGVVGNARKLECGLGNEAMRVAAGEAPRLSVLKQNSVGARHVGQGALKTVCFEFVETSCAAAKISRPVVEAAAAAAAAAALLQFKRIKTFKSFCG